MMMKYNQDETSEKQRTPKNVVGDRVGTARSADRALDILELLSGHGDGFTLSEIAQELEIPPSSLHGILRVLVARRYLAPPDVKRRYRLGAKVIELGAGYLGGSGLYTEARRLMRDLADLTHETVQLAVLEHGQVLYLDTIEGRHSMRVISPIGERLPAHATAAGKALLSVLSDDEVAELYKDTPPQRYTRRTITSVADLLRDLHEARRFGLARDTEEYVEGLTCVATLVMDRAGQDVAVSVSVPTARMTPETSIALARRLQAYGALPVREGYARPASARGGGRPRVAWSMGTMAAQAYEAMYRAAHRAADDAGIDLLWTNARDDIGKQAADIDLLLAARPDVLLIHRADTMRADWVEALFARARDAHIPALCFQRPARTTLFDAYIGTDTYSVGRLQVDFVAAQLGGRGNLVVIEGDPYNDNARNIAQGVLDTVARYPHLRILAQQPAASWSPEAARAIARDALNRHGTDINAFIVANDAMAGGVADALIERGLAGSIVLVGADGDEAARERIAQGVQHGTAFQNPVDLAEAAVSFAAAVAIGDIAWGGLPFRGILHNPPGPHVRVRDVPYLFVSHANVSMLARYWSAQPQGLARTVAS